MTRNVNEKVKRRYTKDNQLSVNNSEPFITSSTCDSTTMSGDTYIQICCAVFVLAIDVCVFFVYSKRSSQTMNNEQLNKDPVGHLL